MAAVREKIPPRYYSLAAIAAGLVVSGALWVAGAKDPARYAVTMTHNNHGNYGSQISCYACHVPEGSALTAFQTSPGCLTGACHGELKPDTPPEEKVRLAQMAFMEIPNGEERAADYLAMHESVKNQECWSCHAEHRDYYVKWPKDWGRDAAKKGEETSKADTDSREDYVSVALLMD